MKARFYWYPKCSNCRKAHALLRERGVAVDAHDLGERPPMRSELEELWKQSGLPLKKFFNTSGQSYRQGGFKDRLPEMDEAAQLDALAADGMLVKRPILQISNEVLVGFRPDDWNSTFDRLS